MEQLIEERKQKLQELEHIKRRVDEIEDQIFAQLQGQVKPQGATTVQHNGHKITVTIPMRPSWDKAKLLEIAARIKAHGDDPEQYMSFEPSVSEKSFNAWPDQIKQVFQPARTIKPGKRKIEVKEG
jgi:hypothetical protein